MIYIGKNPAFQFYVKDWLGDPLLKMVSYQTKGIWIDLLCYLWEAKDRGSISATSVQFQKMLGCNAAEWDTFIEEMTVTKFGNFQNDNGIVTIKNRRMFREERQRKNTYLRVKRYRSNAKSNAPDNANVTPPSSSSSSLINNNKEISNSVTLPKPDKNLPLHYWRNQQNNNYVCAICQAEFISWPKFQTHFKDHIKNA